MGFADNIKAFEKKALTDANNSVSKVFRYATTMTVDFSPSPPGYMGYSTGALKGSWFATIGKFSAEISTSPDDSGASSKARVDSVLATMPFLGKDNMITFQNNTPYAYRVEMIGWPAGLDSKSGWTWTGNAKPYRMVALAMMNVKGAYSR